MVSLHFYICFCLAIARLKTKGYSYLHNKLPRVGACHGGTLSSGQDAYRPDIKGRRAKETAQDHSLNTQTFKERSTACIIHRYVHEDRARWIFDHWELSWSMSHFEVWLSNNPLIWSPNSMSPQCPCWQNCLNPLTQAHFALYKYIHIHVISYDHMTLGVTHWRVIRVTCLS